MKYFLLNAIVVLMVASFVGCTNVEPKSDSDSVPVYEQFQTVFKGNPRAEEIQKLMDAIIEQYGMENTDKLKNQIASALLGMSNDSAVGVTEMDIMKYMYQNPQLAKPLPTAIAEAAFILEKIK